MGTFLKSLLPKKHRGVIPLILLFVLVAFVMVWGRAFYGSMKAYERGMTCLESDQHVKAVTFFDRAIRWYTPLNPYVRQSAERLWTMALEAEKRGDVSLALMATRTIRRGFYAARSFHTPGQDWIDRCDAKIRGLVEASRTRQDGRDAAGQTGHGKPNDQGSQDPGLVGSILTEIGFLGWIGSVIAFMVLGCRGDRQWRWVPSAAWVWGGLALAFFSLWIVGLMKA